MRNTDAETQGQLNYIHGDFPKFGGYVFAGTAQIIFKGSSCVSKALYVSLSDVEKNLSCRIFIQNCFPGTHERRAAGGGGGEVGERPSNTGGALNPLFL